MKNNNEICSVKWVWCFILVSYFMCLCSCGFIKKIDKNMENNYKAVADRHAQDAVKKQLIKNK